MSDLPTYVLERVFDAPRELVWKTWTDPRLLPRWPELELVLAGMGRPVDLGAGLRAAQQVYVERV